MTMAYYDEASTDPNVRLAACKLRLEEEGIRTNLRATTSTPRRGSNDAYIVSLPRRRPETSVHDTQAEVEAKQGDRLMQHGEAPGFRSWGARVP